VHVSVFGYVAVVIVVIVIGRLALNAMYKRR